MQASSVLPALALALSCVTVSIPTRDHPVPMCSLSCPDARSGDGGFMMRLQHICAGKRWYQDITVIGEHTVRGADGAILSTVWIAAEPFYERGETTRQWREIGDFPKIDVERGTCDSYIARICQSSGNCAAHPGEPEPGH